MSKKYVLWLLLIFWCGLIFFFSSQPATESSTLSHGFASFFTDIILRFKEVGFPVLLKLDDADLLKFVMAFEVLIRKLAHFFIFSILGVISSCLARLYPLKRRTAFSISLIFCILYAVSDEFHQHFVAGRSPQLMDLIIDSSGALLGILVVAAFAYIKKMLAQRK